ncbi:LysM peptidoglycan-binding domain-containing protein [Faecalicatena acetigenes]|uniref:LysM peptidoglycan-binding domain-containing protein n=1 Tax=Faecalicatena acetigenes TaxID=2981790 RepID=A0ABT2TCX3_9FIRM|nr:MULTISPECIES: LysM peptidoglycan-binding domain-containing protein [Lachnospiraceae]MCU6748123.1 LysM peptidoglycan-binding domain-containing protein [Faecalicatena acetigenes]SCI27179.1 LysM domain/BON superfamily protein [uncultured Clostridium sp.]
MERQIPKNVRQIGNVSDSPKIYVEDYVDTFFTQICDKAEEGPVGAFLIGDMQKTEEDEYVYIYGAIRMHDLKLSGKDYVIDEDTWKKAYEDCKQYFEDGEMLGWFVAHAGVPLTPEHSTIKLHKKSFPKKNTVFIMKDPIEKDEIYYVHKLNDLLEIGGHYTYYEKNPCMQNYMISARKKNGVCPSETVEDRAAKDFRSMVRNREESQQQKKANRLIYAVSACLLLVVIIMGVTMVNNFDKMKSVQTTLKHLTDTAATDTNSMEIQETSGTVTAVTEETEQKETQQKETQQEEALQDIGQAGGVQEGAEDTQDTEEAKAQSGENGGDGVYVVEEGDTLAIISKKMYGDVDHVEAICKMNGITDGNLIYVGQKLLLP